MTRRILASLALLTVCVAVAGCGGGDTGTSDTGTTPPADDGTSGNATPEGGNAQDI